MENSSQKKLRRTMNFSTTQSKKRSRMNRTRRNLRPHVTQRFSFIDMELRSTLMEYQFALEEKAHRYGKVSGAKMELFHDGYILPRPEGWDESTMGEWVLPVKLSSNDDDGMAELTLIRTENNERILGFRKYFKNKFNTLLRARKRLNQFETEDVDINNALYILHSIVEADNANHHMNHNVVMKSVLDFVTPNHVNYKRMTPPRMKQRRVKSV